MVRGLGYETYNTREVKKEHKAETKENGVENKIDEEVREDLPAPLVTDLNNIFHSFFSAVEVYIKNQQTYNSIGLYAHMSYISKNFKEVISEHQGVLHCEVYDYQEFLDEIIVAPLSEPFLYK